MDGLVKNPANNPADRLPARSPGRPKGSKNKFSLALKEALQQAFDEVGGKEYLVRLADEQPKIFAQLLAKLLPTEITGADGSDLIPKSTPVLVIPAELSVEAWTAAVKDATK